MIEIDTVPTGVGNIKAEIESSKGIRKIVDFADNNAHKSVKWLNTWQDNIMFLQMAGRVRMKGERLLK